MGRKAKNDWIKNLPAGEYTIQQILKFANLKSAVSAKIIMIKYGATVTPVVAKGSVYRDMFTWPGFTERNIK